MAERQGILKGKISADKTTDSIEFKKVVDSYSCHILSLFYRIQAQFRPKNKK